MEILDSERERDEVLRANDCRRLLLEAGADPTLTLDPGVDSFLDEIAATGVPVSLSNPQ
jgi:hypothetical protein